MTMSYTPTNVVDQGDLPATFNSTHCLTWDGQQLVTTDNPFPTGDPLLGTLTRNGDGSFTPSNMISQGVLAMGVSIRGITWDGAQLVFSGGRTFSVLTRNVNGTYTPGNITSSGTLPISLGATAGAGVTWDGQQIVTLSTSRLIGTLTRNVNGTYTPGNAVLQGTLPSAVSSPVSLTWDGTQLVLCGRADRELFTLARNANGSYTPANAVSSGIFPSSVSNPRGLAWDGDKLIILADN